MHALRHLRHLHPARIHRRNTYRLGRFHIPPTVPIPIPRLDSSMIGGEDDEGENPEGEEAAEHDAKDDTVGERGFGVVVRLGPGVGG